MPTDEEERLKHLHQYAILDTPDEEGFARVVRLAQHLFRVPIAFISFIDRDRQWIKSSIGLEVCESNRDISFCAHAILTDRVLVVPDATLDERFCENPLVTSGQRLRSYAGAPIILPEGYRVGAVGVMDTKNRSFSEVELTLLQDLAAMVVSQLELHLMDQVQPLGSESTLEALPTRLPERYEKWVAERTRPWRESNEQLQSALEQQQSQGLELRASEQKYRRLVEHSTDAIVVTDETGTIVETNKAAWEMLGYQRDEIIGHHVSEFNPPEDHEMDAENLSKLARGESLFFEREMVRKDGSRIDIELGVRKIAEGLLQATARDISARKRDEAQLRETNDELEMRVKARTTELDAAVAKLLLEIEERHETERALHEVNRRLNVTFESISDGFYSLNKEWEFTYANASAERITGRAREQLIGRKVWEAIPDIVDTAFWTEYQNAASSGIPSSFEEFYPPSNKWYQIHCYPSSEGLSIYFQDISRRKEVELALQKSKEEADRASAAKTEFLSRMSHELRTPLNAILGFAQLFELEELGPDEHENIQQILRAGHHLLDLINEVLDVARVESGQMTLSIEPVALGQLTQEVLELVNVMASSRRITLYNEIGTDGPFVYADRQRLKQVLLNLIANAIKYNYEGGEVRLELAGNDQEKVRLEVHDSGRGITREGLEKLFTPFERLGIEDSTIEGTGIGLALSKKLIELMNGSIGARSIAHQGSTFWIELPHADDPVEAALQEAESLDPNHSEMAFRSVLYIEDNLSNLKLVERILSRRPDIKLMAGMQGGVGLDLAKEHQPELILLDLHLPDLPGHEVLRRLKSNPETHHIPVVVLSADATPKQIERLRDAGVCDYLTKPINVRRFLSVLNQCLKQDGDRA